MVAVPPPSPSSPARRGRRLLGAVLLLSLSACSGDCGKPTTRRSPSAPPKPAFPPAMTPFDDFSEAEIDPARWTPKDSYRGFADRMTAPQLALIDRRIDHGALRLSSSLTGETTSGPGTAVAHFRATMTEPRGINALEAAVTVHGVQATPCPGSAAFSFTRATIGGLFFNSGAARGRKLVGDVLAVVGVSRRSDTTDPPNRLRTMAVVLSCRRPCYVFAAHLPAGRPPSEVIGMKDLGPLDVGQRTRLGLGWDPQGDRFVFWRDGQVAAEVGYALADDAAPTIERRHLDVAHFVPRCEGSTPARARLDVSFDDVRIQRAASDASPPG
jgi:hypothetical protein